MSRRGQIVLRLLMIGDSGAGKSSVLLRYTKNEFNTDYMATIAIDFQTKNMEINGKPIAIQVWDTAGQERFRTITHNYYRGAQGIVLVYDVSSEASFVSIRRWIRDVRSYVDGKVPVDLILLGNKCDLKKERVIEIERGQKLAEEYGIPFWETSAKSGTNVEEAFSTLVQKIFNRTNLPSPSKISSASPTPSPNKTLEPDNSFAPIDREPTDHTTLLEEIHGNPTENKKGRCC